MNTSKKNLVLGILLGVFAVFLVFVYFSHQVKTPAVVQSVPATPEQYVGKWVRGDSNNFDNVSLEISNPTATGFRFSFDAQSGAHTGTWSNYDEQKKITIGTMTIASRTAHYTDNPADLIYTNEDGTVNPPCTGDFILSDDGAVFEVKTNCSEIYAGFGVSFEGTFRKDAYVEQVGIESSDLFMANPGAYTVFANLVGTHVDPFNQTIAIESNDDYADSELGVVSASEFAVPHAFTQLESIVIVNPHRAVWAAVIDWDDTAQKAIVRYMTTEAKWKKKLPKMIKDWKEGFDEYPVIYSSK